MRLRVCITGVDNGYIIEKQVPNQVGIPEATHIASTGNEVIDIIKMLLDIEDEDNDNSNV